MTVANPNLVVHDVVVSLASGVALKGCGLIQQLVGYDSEGPPIATRAVVCSPV